MKYILPIFLVISQVLMAQIPSYVPVAGLQCYYPFNGNGNDAGSLNNHLTNNGAVLTTDRFGNTDAAYNFNGSTQYLIRNTPSFTFNPSSTFTVSLWHNRNTSSVVGIPIMHGSNAAGNFIWIFQTDASNMQFGTNKQQAAWIWAQSTSTTNAWTHIVLVYNAGAMTLYKDNVAVATATFTHTGVTSTTLPLYIGKGIGGSYFNGKIDDIGIWNRCLSACEINDLYMASNTLTTVSAGPDLYACNGGSVTLSGSGASTYLWAPNVSNGATFSPSVNQTYTVTGFDANGCSAWDQTNILLDQFSINAGPDLFTCPGDSITLLATGANNLIWNGNIPNDTTFVPLTSATYVVSGVDSIGCTDSDTLQLFYGTFPNLNAGPDQSVCFGQEVTLTGTGGIFMYWDNNIPDSVPFVPQTSGNYVLNGASNEGCLGTDTVFVNVNAASSNTISAAAIDSYTINGQTYTASGTYTQILTNSVGCDSLLTINLTLDFTGLAETEQLFSLFPNPVKDIFVIAVAPELFGQVLHMMNIEGKQVLSELITTANHSVNVQALPAGIYFLQIGEGVQKVLVE
jgi:hypothetical protein